MNRYLLRFLTILRPQAGRLTWATVLMLLVVVLQLPLPLFSRYFIDTILPQKNIALLNISILALLAIFAIREAASILNEYIVAIFKEVALFSIQLRLFQHVQRLGLSWFKKHQSGYLVSRIFNDTNNLQGFLSDTASNFLKDSLTLLAGITVIFCFSWKLALISLITWPLFIYSIFYFSPRLKTKSREVQERIATMTGFLQESLTGIYLVKSYMAEKFEARKFVREMRRLLSTRLSYTLMGAIATHLIALVGSLSALIMLWYGGILVIRQEISLGVLMAFSTLLSFIYGPTHRLINLNTAIQNSIGSLERIYELFDEPQEGSGERHLTVPQGTAGKVEFNNLSFGYTPEKLILNDVNLVVQPGEMVALVGRSGAGKTTLCNLLLGFFEPRQGEIRIDGINIKEISLRNLRSIIGIVPQEDFLFSGSIRDNIALGNPGACMEDIIRAAQSAQVHDVIMALPEGYESKIGERGTKLSGGERQRTALARALIKDPGIIIFDEATSELDSQTEQLVKKALENLLVNRTTFVIAHRHTTIDRAQKIVVMESGRIIAMGTHKELYETCPYYKRLYDLQFAADDKGEPDGKCNA